MDGPSNTTAQIHPDRQRLHLVTDERDNLTFVNRAGGSRALPDDNCCASPVRNFNIEAARIWRPRFQGARRQSAASSVQFERRPATRQDAPNCSPGFSGRRLFDDTAIIVCSFRHAHGPHGAAAQPLIAVLRGAKLDSAGHSFAERRSHDFQHFSSAAINDSRSSVHNSETPNLD